MELGIAATSLGGGFFGGIVIGYAMKKVAKLIANATNSTQYRSGYKHGLKDANMTYGLSDFMSGGGYGSL